ncbi:MAG: metallophosphoesterase [Paludibacteraceae bacterium]|nr:metallophosphoesterase [Paludibacteraceae bacterium]
MKKIFYLIPLVLLVSCSKDFTLDIAGMFSPQGPVVNTRFEQSVAYNDSVGEIHLDMGSDTYSIYVCTDSHITKKTHKNLDYFMAQYNAAAQPKLALHLGDLIDAQENMPCADSVLHVGGVAVNQKPAPSQSALFVTAGNHDIYFYQWKEWRSYFHTSTYWFDTRNGSKKLDLFICLDSAEGEIGTKQMKWLKNLLEEKSKEGYRRIIVFTHTHLWKLDSSQGHTSNMALEATYELSYLLAQNHVESVWSGHQHARQLVNYKGVEYRVLNATKDQEQGQSYMIADMGETIEYRYINYPKK